MPEQHEWVPGKTFWLSCGKCGVDKAAHVGTIKTSHIGAMTGTAVNLAAFDEIIYVGGRRSGKSKALKEMVRRYEINKEIFNEFEFMFETKDEISNWEFSFDGSSGILTASENTNGVTVNRELITKKFRLMEVRG